MSLMKARDVCLAMALLLVPLVVHGKEAGPTSSMLTLELARDSADTREAYADLDLGLKNGLHLRGMAGKSRRQGTDETLETTSRLVGISSDYGASLVGGFDYEYWGDQGSLETRTSRFKLGANTDNWYVQLTYEDRRSRIYTKGSIIFYRGKFIQLPDIYELDSAGKGINISYYGFYPWSLSLSYIKYDYNRDTTVLEKYPGWAKQRFSLATLGMATGLEAWRRSADLSYNFDWGTIGINGSQSESAVDKSIASTGSVYLIWEMHRDWSMTLTAGESGIDTSSETTTFGRAALTYRW